MPSPQSPNHSRWERFKASCASGWAQFKAFWVRLWRYVFPVKTQSGLNKPIPIKAVLDNNADASNSTDPIKKSAPSPVISPDQSGSKSVLPDYARPIISNPIKPPRPFWWDLPEDAYQKLCNKAVSEAMGKNQKGYDFVISDKDRREHELEERRLIDNRNRLKDKPGFKEAFDIADEAWRSFIKWDEIQKRHIRAFQKAIEDYGHGYDFRVNGLGFENIKDVGGENNNCGANSLFHIMLENLERFSMDVPNERGLLKALHDKLVEEQQKENKLWALIKEKLDRGPKKSKVLLKMHNYDARSIKEYILYKYPNHDTQDELFGPVVRKHLASVLSTNNEYFTRWTEMVSRQDDVEEPELDAQQRLNRSADHYENSETRFKEYYSDLGDEQNAIMITVDEVAEYARIMGFKINTYRLEDNAYKPYALSNEVRLAQPKFTANIVNVSDIHWQYDVTPSRYPDGKKPSSRLTV